MTVGAALAGATTAAAHAEHIVDVAHFWISRSESEALDVFRNAWTAAGHRWVDMPTKNKVAVQRMVADRIANGYPPAVMQWNANEGSGELPEMGVVQDIEPIAKAGRWREVLPATVLDRISHEGRIYFAPTNIHAENWLWTSAKIFRELGLSQPRSWDEVFAAAQAIEAAGHRPIAIGGAPWEVSILFNDIVFHTLGADGYARVISGEPGAALEPGMIEALRMLRRLSVYAEPRRDRAAKTWADATAAVGRGEAGMQFMGDWAKGELSTLGFAVDRDFGCSLAPGTEIAYFMVIDAFAFPLTNRDGMRGGQLAFAEMVLDKANQLAFSRIKGSLPARLDVDVEALDRCGRLGLEMIAEKRREVNAQSMAMPSQMSEGWIAVLSDFFDDPSMTPEQAQTALHDVLMQR